MDFIIGASPVVEPFVTARVEAGWEVFDLSYQTQVDFVPGLAAGGGATFALTERWAAAISFRYTFLLDNPIMLFDFINKEIISRADAHSHFVSFPVGVSYTF